MLPQISYDIKCLTRTRAAYHDFNPGIISIRWYEGLKIYILNISCHTHIKHSKPYIFIIQKVNKPPDVFYNHLLFESEIIITFSGIFSNSLSMILKVNPKWIRVSTADFEIQRCRTRRENPKSIKTIRKTRNKPPKCHTKKRPFVFWKNPNDRICHILSSRVEL